MQIIIHGIRLIVERRGNFVIVKLDLRNAFNEATRAVVLHRLAMCPETAYLVPLFHATHAPEAYLAVGPATERLFAAGTRGGGDSSEGFTQGRPGSSPGFCVAIQPEVLALDAEWECASAGGCARFFMDDGYAAGPPHVVFPAVQRFADAIFLSLGLVVRFDKLECFSRMYDLEHCPYRLQQSMPPPIGAVEVRATDDMPAHQARGIIVCGTPIGAPSFVSEHVHRICDVAASHITTVVDQLRDHRHHTWASI
jgi:hypothetical protein